MKYNLEVPTSLKGYTLRQYQGYNLIESPDEEDLLECFLDIDKKTLRSIKSSSITIMLEKVKKVLESKNHKLIPIFKLNGVDYGFEPNLDECSYGVNKDSTTYLSDLNTYHKALNVLFRPITKRHKSKYLIESYEGTGVLSEDMRDVTLDIVFGMTVFFWTLTKDLLNYIPKSILPALKEELQRSKDLGINGGLTKKYTHLLEEILQSTTKLQD